MDETLRMMQDITNAIGPSGFEFDVANVLKSYIEPLTQSIERDNLGGVYGTKVGDPNGPKILFAGHMDDVCFMVRKIHEDGFIHFRHVGYMSNQVILGQRVRVRNRKGQLFEGIIGPERPPHMLIKEGGLDKMVPFEEMIIDIGARSKQQVEEEYGIHVGDFILPVSDFYQLTDPDMLVARSWDDRVSLCVMIEVLKRLQKENHPNIFVAAGTVQEELGTIGAFPASQVVKPDVAIIMESGIAEDTPAFKPEERFEKLGGGATIALKDGSTQYSYRFRNLAIDTAKENNIPYQTSVVMGGATDAAAIHPSGIGVPAICINVASRYIHTYHSLIDRNDFDAAVDLIVNIVKKLDWETVRSLF